MINITKAIDHSLQGVELDFDYDFICLMTAVAISLIGLVCVFSSSIDIVYKQANDPFFIVKKQLIFSIVGLVIGFVVYKIPMYVWHKLGPYLLVVGFVLLVAVLIPGIGRDVKGASRWINLGFFNLQVAELVKLFFVMYMAGYLVRRQDCSNIAFITAGLRYNGCIVCDCYVYAFCGWCKFIPIYIVWFKHERNFCFADY